MSSSKGQESSFLRSGFRFASVPNRIVSLPRTAVLGTAFLTVCGFMYSLSSLYVPSPRYHEQVVASNTQLKHDHAKLENVPISNSLQRLFDAIRLPISAPSYTDDKGNTFEIEEEGSWWDEPLKKQILIVDIDTRVPDKTNELWSEGSMDWEKLEETGGGMLSASQMNHFLYAQIHGYDYRFYHAHEMEGWHSTWVKPHVFLDLLPLYKFVVFLDGDANFQHLDVPLEWMFNRWGITPETSLAMPLDVGQDLGDAHHVGEDSRGNMEQNTGVIVAQNLPYTYDILTAWRDCPLETAYPGCKKWQTEWAHEQTAWSEYIRYDFNPNGTNIVYIPGDDAMGFPGLGDNSWIRHKYNGQFIRHHTIFKEKTKRDSELAILQAVANLARRELLGKREYYWMVETEREKLREVRENGNERAGGNVLTEEEVDVVDIPGVL